MLEYKRAIDRTIIVFLQDTYVVEGKRDVYDVLAELLLVFATSIYQ